MRPLIPIIDRYILWESLKTFLAVLTVLLLILISHGFMKALQKAAVGALSSQVLLEMVTLQSISILGRIVPPAFFLSILYTLGRLYRDSEMTAMAAGGVGPGRIYRAFFLLAVPVALVVAWMSLSLAPWVNQQMELLKDQKTKTAELGSAVAGRFNEFSQGELVFYIEGMSDDRERLQKIFVQNRQHGKLGLITAAEGRQYQDPETGDHFVILEQGRRYEGDPGRRDFSIGEFERYGVRVMDEMTQRNHWPENARPSSELWGSTDIKERAELEERLMFPIAVLVFTLVSIPLSHSLPREGVYGRIMLAILFYTIFINLQAVSETWMENGVTPAWMGRWWVHFFVLGLAGMVMLSRRYGLSALIKQLRLARRRTA